MQDREQWSKWVHHVASIWGWHLTYLTWHYTHIWVDRCWKLHAYFTTYVTSFFISHFHCYMHLWLQVQQQQIQSVVFTIPISEPLPSQYYVRVISDRWLGSEMTFPISFQHLILPEKHLPHTGLVNSLMLSFVLSLMTGLWLVPTKWARCYRWW